MPEIHTIIKLYVSGMGKKEIARQTGCSRNTIKKYLKQYEDGTLGSKKLPKPNEIAFQSSSQWHKYHNDILEMLQVKNFRKSRVFQELRKLGAEGSESSFYDYLKRLKEVILSSNARGSFDTAPGVQAQFDWSPYTVKIGNRSRKIIVFTMILGFSRYRFSLASFSDNQSAMFECLRQGFEYFGGTPEELLMDNAAQMVTNASHSHFQWNSRFLHFMDHYHVKPKRCQVKHSWTKGKVENPFRYLEDHFIQGGEFSSLAELNQELQAFNEGIHQKHHKGINTKPCELFEIEKPYLKPLPKNGFVNPTLESRKVSNHCFISYDANYYSVPMTYSCQKVWVENHLGNELRIYSQKHRLIATHELVSGKGNYVKNPDHFQSMFPMNPVKDLENQFRNTFPTMADHIQLIKDKSEKKWKSMLYFLLSLDQSYTETEIGNAVTFGIQQNYLHRELISTYLKQHYDIKDALPIFHSDKITKESMKEVKRDIAFYDSLVTETANHELSNHQGGVQNGS